MNKLCALLLVPVLCVAAEPIGERLDWMLGCWTTPDGSAIEVWSVEDERTLVGFSVTVRENSVAFYEVLTVRQDDEGTLTYTARPSGQTATSFVAEKVGEDQIVFENAAHDYPQQISYKRTDNLLDATIALLGGANPNHFNKVACGDD